MHVLSTIGLAVCISGLSLAVASAISYITDRSDSFAVSVISIGFVSLLTLAATYGLSILMALE